jgi:hypothetical protein
VVPAVSKPYTESDLSAQLAEDRTWRIREISDLKSAVLRADPLSRRVLLRALVTICYAHWEGHVRFAAGKYLEHVALRRFTLAQLERQFTRNHFFRRLSVLASARGSFADRSSIVDEILDAGTKRFARFDDELVSTRSNLNFEVFSEICTVCGLAVSSFQEFEPFMDVILLKRRNAIAHGEDTFVSISDLDLVSGRTIEMMRQFGDALENHSYLKRYRAS